MKQLLFSALLLTTYQALYVMDKEIVLDEKSVQKIVNCTTKCANDHWEDLRDVSHKKPIQVCTDICTTLYKSRALEKAQKAHAQFLIEEIKKFRNV